VSDIAKQCRELEEQIIEWRREFHLHPEISHKEVWTGQRIQELMDRFDIPWVALPDSTSFIATLDSGRPGKTLVLRADIDGLPVEEKTGLPFASQQPGAMHACGHDAHIAMMLGAVKLLEAKKKDFKGKIHICWQSAEEQGGGAVEQVQWLIAHGGVDRVAALHIWSSIPGGTLMLYPGPTMSGLFAFKITIKGEGGHGSRPDMVRDPIKAACDLALQLSSIPVNYYDALDHSVVHIGQVNGGTAANIFPETAEVVGGVRYFNPAGPPVLIDIIKRMIHGIELIHQVDIRLDMSPILTPVMNDAQALAEAKKALDKVKGLDFYDAMFPLMGSDNYSVFTSTFPGFYGFLGAANEEKGINWQQHSPHFDIDESVLRLGTEFFVRYALDYLD
jgi:amidohydrolase